MVLYISKFQMAISSFIFNIETSGLKRTKANEVYFRVQFVHKCCD